MLKSIKNYLILLISKWEWILLACILLFAFIVRFAGVKRGLPYIWYFDETQLANMAFTILRTGDYNPHFFDWPSLNVYLQAIVASLCYLYAVGHGIMQNLDQLVVRWDWITNNSIFYIWGRTFTVLLSVFTVATTYKICSKCYSTIVAVMASLLLASSVNYIHYSRVIAVDVPTVFFVIITYYLATCIVSGIDKKMYMFAGLLAGLSIAGKYNSWPIVVVLVLAYFFSKERKSTPVIYFYLMMFFVGVGFFLGCPYSVLDLSAFLRAIGGVILHYRSGHPGAEGPPGISQLIYYYHFFCNKNTLGKVFMYFSLLGIGYGFIKNWRYNLLLLCFPVIYMWYMCNLKVNFTRNVLIIIPFLCIFASLGINCLFECITRMLTKFGTKKKYILIGGSVLCVVILFYPISNAVKWARHEYEKKDSRVLVEEWINENIAPEYKVAIAEQIPWQQPGLDRLRPTILRFDQKGDGLSLLIENGLDYLVASDKYLYLGAEKQERYKQLIDGYNNYFGDINPLKTFGTGGVRLDLFSVSPQINIYKVDEELCDLIYQHQEKHIINLDATEDVCGVSLGDFRGGKYCWDEKAKQLTMVFANQYFSSPRIRFIEGKYKITINASGSVCDGEYPLLEVVVVWWDQGKKLKSEKILEKHVDDQEQNYNGRSFICSDNDVCSFIIKYLNDKHNPETKEDRNLLLKDFVVKKLE